MTMPPERDVPHWAIEPVQIARDYHKLSDKVTDRMIYARLLSLGNLKPSPANVIENSRVASLEQEVLNG